MEFYTPAVNSKKEHIRSPADFMVLVEVSLMP